MGEIGAMMARLEQEGLNLEQLIDCELEAAGFLSRAARSTDSLTNRIDAISGNQSELKCLLKSIEDQLRMVQEEENIPENLFDDKNFVDDDKGVKHVIVIDDDEEKPKSNFGGQADVTPGCFPAKTKTSQQSKTATSIYAQPLKPVNTTVVSSQSIQTSKHAEQRVVSITTSTISKTETQPINGTPPPLIRTSSTTTQKTLSTPAPLKIPTPPKTLTSPKALTLPKSSAQSNKLVPILPKAVENSIGTMTTPVTTPMTSPLNTPESVIAYRTLRSPSEDGPAKSVVSMITVKSSPPVLPPQQLRGATTPTTPSMSTMVTPVTQANSTPTPPAEATAASVTSTETERPNNKGPPKFEEGTRIIGKRSDDLWYPGEIIKVMTDRYSQTKFRVKFDQGNRGLLRSNHVALETCAPVDVLDVGSRVVGPYGKLDVLYAGIVAEKSCPETSNRFLIFFDDGFAQYLPLQKLHHVYNTGDKVWNEVAEHSQEFIQEYLEEFPNRPMVVLKVNQWVKTEWRGKWLKAKVMQVDCSLVKMLFQVDNRTEWIYRGSTRLEPLFKALINGKISKKKNAKRPKKHSQIPDEPYVDFTATKREFGFSSYSKTDPKGLKQQKSGKGTTEGQQSSTPTQTGTPQGSSTPMSSGTPSSTLAASSTPKTQLKPTTLTTPTTLSSLAGSNTSVPLSSQPTTTTPTVSWGTQTQTPNVLAVKTLKRLANKINDGSVASPSNNTTVSDTRNTKRFISQPTKVNSYSLPSSTMNTGWTSSSHNGDISPNHFSSANHFDDSNASIIASTVRKRTTAGLNMANKTHMLGAGPEMVITGVRNGLVPSIGLSPKKMWQAPWKQNNHTKTDINDVINKETKVKVNNSKHDAAALIQERLQAQKKLVNKSMPEVKSLIPKPPVLGPHQCGKQCGQAQIIDKEEKAKHNVLALPLLLNWKREITKRHPRHKREIYYRAPCNKRLRTIEDVAKYLLMTGTCNVAIDQFCYDPEISCTDVFINSDNILIPDISLGQESVAISAMNEHDSSLPPSIDYVRDRILSDGVHINTDPGFLACCDCTDNCQDKTKCSCAQLTISASAAVDGKVDNSVGYEYRRLMDTVPTGIYECNQNCACSSQCFNRVVQNNIQLRLQVFKTENRGWGLRTLDDIPVGTFICTYSGQIMNEDMANKEGRDFGDEYLAELDHIEVVEKIKEGYESSVSDLEDDSVILNTLETGISTSELSDNGSVCGSFLSDTDSDDSDSSHSSYSPRAKKHSHSKRKSPESVKITEDGTTFSVTMADENCLMAITSGESIVLRRIGDPGAVKQEHHPTVKQEPSKDIKDPPSMPKPTVIDLTSDDEDNSLIKCSINEKKSDQTFYSSKQPKTENKSPNEGSKGPFSTKLEKTIENIKPTVQRYTDFKLFDISNSNVNATDVSDGCHDNNEVKNKVKTKPEESINRDLIAKPTKVLSSDSKSDEKSAEKDSDASNKMELETTVELIIEEKTPVEISSDIASPSHVTCSISEATKQEEMETDPCLRKQPQKPCNDKEMSPLLNSDKPALSDNIPGDSRHDNKETSPLLNSDKPALSDIPKDSHHDTKETSPLLNTNKLALSDNILGDSRHDNKETSPLFNTDKPALSDNVVGDSSHNKDTAQDNKPCEDKASNQVDSCHGNIVSLQEKVPCKEQDNSCQDEKVGNVDCHDKENLQDNKNDNLGSDDCSEKNDKVDGVNNLLSDKNDHHGDKNKDCNADNKNDNEISIENPDIKIGNVDEDKASSQEDDVMGDSNGNKEQEEQGSENDNGNDRNDNNSGVDFELRMEIDESIESIEGKESDTQSNPLSGKSFNFTKTASSDDDSVPPLMSADDLSKIAAQIHQPDEEPPKLTKMQPGSRLTVDLHDTIAKLQSRGVALNSTGPELPEGDSTQSLDDLPLFPSASSCDSFPASPATSHSGSWISDSGDRSSDASDEQKARRDRMKNDGKRARRFIVTLQKSGVKRSASPDGIEGGPYKKPSTRSLFNGEEHCYVIDAKAYGNCGRYLNHSCSPNLFVQNVFIDTHDLRFPRVAFFAQHNISAGSELTWDYMYEVGSVQDKVLRCYCGSSQCRGRLL